MFHFKIHIKTRTILLFFLVFIVSQGCFQPNTIFKNEWKVVSVNPKNVLFVKGETIAFSTNKVHVTLDGKQRKYSCIVCNNRMVIESPLAKWLFEIETNDSVLVLRELYAKNSLEVKLIKSDKS